MQKATVASLLAIALFIAVAPSLASSADWQTVDNWTNTSGQKVWHTVDTWNDDFQMKYWQTVDSWGNIAEAVYTIGPPTPIAPENTGVIFDTTPVFYWVVGAYANSHRFLLDNDSDFSSPIENASLGAFATEYAITTALATDNYWWKVTAINVVGENDSEVWTFELKAPTGNIFGYQTEGTLGTRDFHDLISGSVFTCPDNAYAESISAYIYATSVGGLNYAKAAIYDYSDNTLVGETVEESMYGFGPGWKTFIFSESTPSLVGGAKYILVIWGYNPENPWEDIEIYYDDGEGTTQGHYYTENYDSWPDPASFGHDDKKYSIYCTYTIAPPLKQWLTADNWGNQVVIEYEYPGSGTVDDPYIIENIWALQGITNLTAHYALDNEIDATITQNWNDNGDGGYFGFDPIGTIANKFTGSFDGRGHTVDNLYINRPSSYHAGLFGYIGSGGVIENVGLDNENVRGGNTVGGLVGRNAGSILNCYTSGIVYGIGTSADYVGGLVGYNDGTVYRCYSTCTVSGDLGIGGLVGFNGTEAMISNCYSVGPVSGANNVGGLVGLGRTFGYETIGASKQNVYDNICGSWFTAPENGVANSITAYVDPGGAADYRFAIYDMSDYALVGYTEESGTLEAGAQWLTLDIEWGGTIVKDLNYALVAWSDGAIMDIYYDYSAAWIGGYVENTDYPTFPDYWNPTTQQRKYSIYCSYTTSINVSNSFWDNVTSGQSFSAGGTGKTTENMKDNRTYTDVAWSEGLDAPWDFIDNFYDDVGDEDIWGTDAAINNGYPYLTVFVPRWQDADVWSNALVTEEPPEPPPTPPADEVVWVMFIVRFLGLVIPFGVVAWRFSNIDNPRDGAETAVWAMLGFVAIVAIWFIADAVEAVLYVS